MQGEIEVIETINLSKKELEDIKKSRFSKGAESSTYIYNENGVKKIIKIFLPCSRTTSIITLQPLLWESFLRQRVCRPPAICGRWEHKTVGRTPTCFLQVIIRAIRQGGDEF